MRKLRFWTLTIFAILALVSLRDKEIVLRVPSGQQLVAEAYQAPAGSQNNASQLSSSAQVPASGQQQSSSSYSNTSPGYSNISSSSGNYTPQSLPGSGSSQSPNITQNLSSPSSGTTNPTGAQTFLGLGSGSVLDTGANTNLISSVNDDGSGNDNDEPSAGASNTAFITGLLQNNAKEGVEVVIQGAGFSTTASENTVKFGLVEATSVSVVSSNQLRAVVPSGLSNGFTDVTVTVSGTDSNTALFDILKDSASNVFTDSTSTLFPSGLGLQDFSIVRFADIDGDKDLDMLVVDKTAAKLCLLVNDGSGYFANETSSRISSTITNNAAFITDIAFGDLDSDGEQDMVISYSQGQAIRLLTNSGTGTFTDETATKIPALSGEVAAIDLGDVDGDGYLDIVLANRDSKDILLVNGGTGSFTKDINFVLPAVIDGSSDIRFCDINNDGALDVITTNNDIIDASSLTNRVYLNNGSGHFTDVTNLALPQNSEHSEVLDIGDLDHDSPIGNIDLLVGSYGQNLLFLNNDGAFEDKTGELMPTNYFHSKDVKLGDLNGDGYLDLVVLGEEGVSLLINNKSGSFKETDASIKLPDYRSIPAHIVPKSVNLKAKSIQLADIDGDGALDIIIGGSALHILKSSADNKSPILDPIGPRQVEAGKALTFNINATDPNGDPIIYSYSSANLPAGATIGATTGYFNWGTSAGDAGDYDVTFVAKEDTQAALQASETVSIKVLSGDLPVIDYYIPVDLDSTAGAGDVIQFGLKAHDPLGGNLTYKWSFNGAVIPSIGIVDSSVIFIIPRIGQNTIKVEVTNASGTTVLEWNVEAGDVNYPPVITSFTPQTANVDIDLTVGAAINIGITADDQDVGDTLTYVWTLDSLTLPVSGADLSAGAYASHLTVGTHTLLVSVSDGHNAPVTQSWTLNVTQSPVNNAPAITAYVPQASTINIDLNQGAALSFGITATDPDNDVLTYIWRLDGIALPSTGAVLGSGAYAASLTLGDHSLSVSVNDGHQHTVTQNWTLHVTQGTTYYSLTINADNGSVTKNPDSNSYVPGTSVTLTATPSAGYTFSDWSGAASGSTNPTTVTMDSDKVVTANFTVIPPLTITSSSGTGGTISPLGAVSVPYGNNQTFTITADTGYAISQVLVDGVDATLKAGTYTFTGVTADHAIHATFVTSSTINDQVIQKSFNYFWNETDNPETGFTRDRLPVNPSDRNATFDVHYNRASMAATGFQLAALCVADNDPSVADGVTHNQLVARVNLILDKLLQIQANQDPDNPATLAVWGKDGFFYHYVDIDTGQRYAGSSVSVIDTTLLMAGVVTAGEYFGGEIKDKALQIYNNVNWKAFLDVRTAVSGFSNPNYNQFYHVWTPERGYEGHWDYTDESLLLYILAVAAPDPAKAVSPETFYAFRRELGEYGAGGRPMVQSWFGQLFVYQYTQAFFNFKDGANLLYDKQGVSWWDNSVEATKANKQYCNNSLAKFAGNEDLWGHTSGYTDGFTYDDKYCAPPSASLIRVPDGTVFPAAAAGSLPFMPAETTRVLNKIKELYDTYGYQVWGDYGFVSSFRLGDTIDTPPTHIASMYCGIDVGVTIVMAQNQKDGLVWNSFAGFEFSPGVTLQSKIEQLLGLTIDTSCQLTVDDSSATANFHTGKIDAQNPVYTVKFDLADVNNAPYLMAINSFMDKELPSHTVTVSVKVNSGAAYPVEFTYDTAGKSPDMMKYIQVDNDDLIVGENTITIEWQSATDGAEYLAWKNIEVFSPVENNIWSFARDAAADKFFGNEYRVDDTYAIGSDISGFEQAINREAENFTDILFYTTKTQADYVIFNIKALNTQDDGTVNLNIYVNGAPTPVFNGQIVSGQQISTQGFYLADGWNRITIYHPGASPSSMGEWVCWDSAALIQAEPSQLSAPQHVGAAAFGNNKIKLRWQAVNYATQYMIYRSETSGGPYGTPIATVMTTSYDDTGSLQSGKSYYYVVKAAKAGDPSGDSQNSAEVGATTGSYRLDYGDGHDPNSFAGATLDNSGTPLSDVAYITLVKYDGSIGKVRKIVLNGGEKNTVELNNANINDATMFTLRVRSNVAGATFQLKLKDSAGGQASVSIMSPTADLWQNLLFYLGAGKQLAGVDLSKIDKLEITSETAGKQITLYIDEVDFNISTINGTAIDVAVIDGASGAQAASIDFGLTTFSTPKVLAKQYIKISNYRSALSAWGMQIYTDNMAADANPRFTGAPPTNPADVRVSGLVGTSDSGYRVPILWQVWDSVKGYYNGTETPEFDTNGILPGKPGNDGDKAEFAFMMDPGDGDWNKDIYTPSYRTIINSSGELGAPVPFSSNWLSYEPRKVAVGTTLYVYLATDYTGAPAQTYTTNKITIDIYQR